MTTGWLAAPIVVFLAATPIALAPRSGFRFDTRPPAAPLPGADAEALTALVLQVHNPPYARDPAPDRRWGGGGHGHGRTVANRNSNPLNIKLGQATRRYVEAGHAEVSEITPLDGGRFLRFDSPERGFRAARDLLLSAAYRNLDLDRVFRRWSNNGFGAEILAGTPLDARATMRQLGSGELKLVLRAMATAEGYRSPAMAAEISRAVEP